jgi:hypothetical protein
MESYSSFKTAGWARDGIIKKFLEWMGQVELTLFNEFY